MILQKLYPRASRGFSLVEVMVALVIGMLAMIVVLQVFWLSEGSKRTSTSGGDAQQSGSLALFTIERDLRQAGFGIADLPTLGCVINGYDTAGSPPRGAFTVAAFSPVMIAQGINDAPDTITIAYSSTGIVVPAATMTHPNGGTNANYQVNNNRDFTVNDLILVVENGNPNCTLAQVNNIPAQGTPGAGQIIIHNTGVNSPRFNVPAGIGIPHGVGSQIYNLGQLPNVNEYSVTLPAAAAPEGQLALQNLIMAPGRVPIMEGIVNLQAEYGMDDGANNATVNHAAYTADDRVIDNWTTAAPADATAWGRVIAVRLAVVARSGLREKPDRVSGVCNATSGTPTWAGSATSPLVFSNDADGTSWRCYRYRIYETTVPLRNMLWRR